MFCFCLIFVNFFSNSLNKRNKVSGDHDHPPPPPPSRRSGAGGGSPLLHGGRGGELLGLPPITIFARAFCCHIFYCTDIIISFQIVEV